MKKTIALILLSVFLFNISGYFVVFNFLQIRIKDFMECLLKEKKSEDLVLVIVSPLTKNNLVWENNNEFRLHGKMYDVAFRRQEGKTVYLYCYNDTKEEHLFASLNRHIKNHIDNSAAHKNSKTILKNPVSDFYTISEPLKISFQQHYLNVFDDNIFPLENILIEFPSPPPQQV